MFWLETAAVLGETDRRRKLDGRASFLFRIDSRRMQVFIDALIRFLRSQLETRDPSPLL